MPASYHSFSEWEREGMAEAKRKLAAILAADVAGYSRLMGDDEARLARALAARRAPQAYDTAAAEHHVARVLEATA